MTSATNHIDPFNAMKEALQKADTLRKDFLANMTSTYGEKGAEMANNFCRMHAIAKKAVSEVREHAEACLKEGKLLTPSELLQTIAEMQANFIEMLAEANGFDKDATLNILKSSTAVVEQVSDMLKELTDARAAIVEQLSSAVAGEKVH